MKKTNSKSSLKALIIAHASKQFTTKGVKAVRMDDVATALGISKRTLYELYDTKETLLMECLEQQERIFFSELAKLSSNTESNTMDFIITFYKLQMRQVANTNPLFYAELHKYKEIIEYRKQRHQHNSERAQQFYMQGVQDGVFRSDINYQIVYRLQHGMMQHVMETRMYETFPAIEIFQNMMFLLICGICTPEGIKEFESKLKNMGNQA